jgi:RNA polymerase sigma-70 factor (ECF subfamily)
LVTPHLSDARRRWLSELYQANSAAVFNLSRRLLDSPEDAADATHEVFLRAAASLSEAPNSPQARAWLMTVGRNHCIDLIRRRERFGSALTTLAATADVGDDSVQAVEDRQLVQTVLQQLGVRDREALFQSAVERRPLAEIARNYGVSYTAAAKLLSRARKRAFVLATRLAVILGLAQLGRAARPSNLAQRSQLVAAVVVMPLVIAAVVGASSPHAPIGADASAQAASVPSLGPSGSHRSPGVSGLLPGTDGSTVPAGTGLLATVLGILTTAVPPGPTPGGVTPNPSPPAPSDIDVDHGKGRDRDDTIHNHPGRGKALGRA